MKTRHLRLLALGTLLIASAGKTENDALPDTLVTGPVKVIDRDSMFSSGNRQAHKPNLPKNRQDFETMENQTALHRRT